MMWANVSLSLMSMVLASMGCGLAKNTSVKTISLMSVHRGKRFNDDVEPSLVAPCSTARSFVSKSFRYLVSPAT